MSRIKNAKALLTWINGGFAMGWVPILSRNTLKAAWRQVYQEGLIHG